MRCNQAQKLLSAHLDDELDPGRRAALESHLADCEACSAALDRLRAQAEALAAADDVPPLPADLWPRVGAALDRAGRQPWHRRHRARLLQTACVTACVVLGFAGGALLSWRQPTVDASGSGAVAERTLVAEAFDTTAFGLDEDREGLFPCVPE